MYERNANCHKVFSLWPLVTGKKKTLSTQMYVKLFMIYMYWSVLGKDNTKGQNFDSDKDHIEVTDDIFHHFVHVRGVIGKFVDCSYNVLIICCTIMTKLKINFESAGKLKINFESAGKLKINLESAGKLKINFESAGKLKIHIFV